MTEDCIKILIGGSPCTFWSVAKRDGREVKPHGMGWELFKNYLIAKEKFAPDIFLYENNKSANDSIKCQIKRELDVWDCPLFFDDTGARYIEINSSLVSAQNRERFYVHSCGDIEPPSDRNIELRSILERGDDDSVLSYPVCTTSAGKAHTLKAQYNNSTIANFITNGGFQATGVAELVAHSPGHYAVSAIDGKRHSVYCVRDGNITVGGQSYRINIPDGNYLIRKLTVKECCRLQTMPDDYCKTATPAEAYKGLGNGWTAEIIIHILNGALKNVSRDERITVLSMYDGIATGRYCLGKMGFTNIEYHAYEIDESAMKIAMSNYPEIIQHGDAFQVRAVGWRL